jgi:hypothetical protein
VGSDKTVWGFAAGSFPGVSSDTELGSMAEKGLHFKRGRL